MTTNDTGPAEIPEELRVQAAGPLMDPAALSEVRKSPAAALQLLREGNVRFMEGRTRHSHASAEWRRHLVGGQQPFATILGCADSRVPVELVFDQGFGDLFVVRVAGNVIAPDVVGSIEYAVVHLQTALIVVLGHQNCGAVTAALQISDRSEAEPPGVVGLLSLIRPALPASLPGSPFQERLDAAVEANVRWSLRQLAELPEARGALEEGRVRLVGGVYELETGRVRFLD